MRWGELFFFGRDGDFNNRLEYEFGSDIQFGLWNQQDRWFVGHDHDEHGFGGYKRADEWVGRHDHDEHRFKHSKYNDDSHRHRNHRSLR
jgi:hypothetical protein